MDNESFLINLDNPLGIKYTRPNLTINNTDDPQQWDGQAETLYTDVVYYIQVFGIPIIIFVGIFCNGLSLSVFLHTRMRSQSCSIYLAYLNVVDSGFLLSMLPIWLAWIDVNIFHREGWCQITIYASYVFAFLSVWTVVAFTVERFIVVYHPFQKPHMCTKKRAVRVLAGLTIGAMLLYSFNLWSLGITESNGLPNCGPKPGYDSVHIILNTIVDTIVTLIIPSAAIIILNGSIIWKILIFYSNNISETFSDPGQTVTTGTKEPLKTSSHSSSSKSSDQVCGSTINSSARHSRIANRMQQSSSRRRQKYQLKTTRALLLISSTFLLLNLPSHFFRLYRFFLGLQHKDPTLSIPALITQELMVFLYYINFASNMFLYVAFSRSFRCGFLSLLKECRRLCARIVHICTIQIQCCTCCQSRKEEAVELRRDVEINRIVPFLCEAKHNENV